MVRRRASPTRAGTQEVPMERAQQMDTDNGVREDAVAERGGGAGTRHHSAGGTGGDGEEDVEGGL